MTSPEQFVQDILTAIGVAGWPACALVGFALAGGLAVWVFGERIFRPATTVMLGFIGMVIGASAAPLVWGGAATPFQVLMSAIGGLAFGCALSVLAYRWALAIGTGVLFACLSPVLVSVAISASGPSDGGQDDWPDELTSAHAPSRPDSWAAATHSLRAETLPFSAELLDGAGRIWSRVAPVIAGDNGSPLGRLRDAWGRQPQAQQGVIAAGAVIGFALGIALGLVRPRWAGVVLTSAVGACVWVPSLAWLSAVLNAPWVSALDKLESLGAPLAAGAVILGIVIQARGMIKHPVV